MYHIFRRLFGVLLATSLLLVQSLAAAEEKSVFSKEQLDQLVAPIALYPDSVVAQILMASTYPLEIVQAQRWQEKNKNLKAEEIDKQGEAQGWDSSVVSMLHFPEVLKMLHDNLDWTQDLGDAVLAQQKDVMSAVQRMRNAAHEAGNLDTTEQQKVVVEEEVIRVEPVTQVVYVPAYNPTVVYGSYPVATPYYSWYSYPPSYWYPPAYPAGAGLVAFGVGMAWGAAIWGDCNWNNGDIDIDINRNTNINNANGKWQHNAEHRQGVRYKDEATRNRFDQDSRAARDQRVAREGDRGFNRADTRDNQSGRRDGTSGNRDMGGRSDQGGSLSDRNTASTRDGYRDMGSSDRSSARSTGSSSSRASTSDRSSSSAFSGNRSGSSTRAASNRGFSSRSGGGMSRGGGGGGRGGRR